MKKRDVAILFVIMGIMMTTPGMAVEAQKKIYLNTPAVSQTKTWTGTWDVKGKGGADMTFILNQSSDKVTGTWSSDLYDGKISLSGKGNPTGGSMTQQHYGTCTLFKMTMSPSGNDFTADLDCPGGPNMSSTRHLNGKRK